MLLLGLLVGCSGPEVRDDAPASPGAATGVVATPTVADPDPTASGAPTGNPSD
ncbi:MAG: plastocyanin, partial [Chloroflexi bacterium]